MNRKRDIAAARKADILSIGRSLISIVILFLGFYNRGFGADASAACVVRRKRNLWFVLRGLTLGATRASMTMRGIRIKPRREKTFNGFPKWHLELSND